MTIDLKQFEIFARERLRRQRQGPTDHRPTFVWLWGLLIEIAAGAFLLVAIISGWMLGTVIGLAWLAGIVGHVVFFEMLLHKAVE